MRKTEWFTLAACASIGEAITLVAALNARYPYNPPAKNCRGMYGVVREKSVQIAEFQQEGVVVRMRGVTTEYSMYHFLNMAEGILVGMRIPRDVVYCVRHEWQEEIEEYDTHHSDLHTIFATPELAKAYAMSKPYKESDNYTWSSRPVRYFP